MRHAYAPPVGVGGIPDAVVELTRHKDRGIHIEMLSDSVIPLIESGVINGQPQIEQRGKMVTGFVLRTNAFEFHPNACTNDPYVISNGRPILPRTEMTWPQYRDGGFTGPVAKMFGVTAIPHTLTIDAGRR